MKGSQEKLGVTMKAKAKDIENVTQVYYFCKSDLRRLSPVPSCRQSRSVS